LASSCRVPNAKIAVKCNPSYSDFLKDFIETVSKSDQVKVQVLDAKPDEITDNKPKEASFNFSSLEGYRDSIKSYYDCFDNALKLSDILLKTKLPKNIHSFKDIEATLTKSKTASLDLTKRRENYELITEQTGHHVGHIIVAINSRRWNDAAVQKIIQASVNHVSANFMTMKKLLASFITSQYSLYDIDKNFKKYTGYPATWFFDPSVFYNFKESYKDVSDSLVEAVKAEASVVRPLYAWHEAQ
jgi:hypothetical protein